MMDPALHRILSPDIELSAEYDAHMKTILRRRLYRFFQLSKPEEAITAYEGADLLEMTQSEFMKRVGDNGWQVRGGDFYNKRFDRQRIEDWKRSSTSVSWQSAIRKLRISDHVMKRVCDSGCIRKVGTFGQGKFVDVDRSDVDRLLAVMAEPSAYRKGINFLSLSAALQTVGPFDITYGDMANALVSGSIRPCGVSKGSFVDIEVPCEEVAHWLKNLRGMKEKPFSVIHKKLILRARKHMREGAAELAPNSVNCLVDNVDELPSEPNVLVNQRAAE
jgi:hypothetical protein